MQEQAEGDKKRVAKKSLGVVLKELANQEKVAPEPRLSSGLAEQIQIVLNTGDDPRTGGEVSALRRWIMKLHQIEYWALSVIERVESGQPNEDFRVELKSQWPNCQKAARQIAGHANAARGESILWLIGIDENKGVIGADKTEMANWYPVMKAQFDGLAPQVVDLNVPVKGATVVALLFETDRAPFVVKNPAYGSPGCGPVQLEVPWREARATRSATRSDLIKLLSPLQQLPSFEVYMGILRVHDAGESKLRWVLILELYVVPKTSTRVIIPFHKCEASFEIPGVVPRKSIAGITLEPSRQSGQPNIKGTLTEIMIDDPGMVRIVEELKTPTVAISPAKDAQVTLKLLPVGAEHPAIISETLRHSPSPENMLGIWRLQ